jgi:hypothetical protein
MNSVVLWCVRGSLGHLAPVSLFIRIMRCKFISHLDAPRPKCRARSTRRTARRPGSSRMGISFFHFFKHFTFISVIIFHFKNDEILLRFIHIQMTRMNDVNLDFNSI